MRICYLILIMLLGIAVPTHGIGAMAAMDACPAHAGMDMAAGSASCCDDAGASGQLPGDACATHCSLSGGCGAIQFVQASSTPSPALTAAGPLPSGNASSLPAPDSFGVWRPPRFL